MMEGVGMTGDADSEENTFIWRSTSYHQSSFWEEEKRTI